MNKTPINTGMDTEMYLDETKIIIDSAQAPKSAVIKTVRLCRAHSL